MSDARIATVADVLREHGHNATGSGADTDTLATAIVNALDAGAAEAEATAETEMATDEHGTPDASAGNPETPVGTGTEGGAGTPAE
jgi:hypothetical protein